MGSAEGRVLGLALGDSTVAGSGALEAERCRVPGVSADWEDGGL